MTELIPHPDRPGYYIAGPLHPAQASAITGGSMTFNMKLSDLIGQLLSMFETHTAFAAHVDDTVAATSAKTQVAAMKANNEALRKMVAEAMAEEEADHSADDLNAEEAAKNEAEAKADAKAKPAKK